MEQGDGLDREGVSPAARKVAPCADRPALRLSRPRHRSAIRAAPQDRRNHRPAVVPPRKCRYKGRPASRIPTPTADSFGVSMMLVMVSHSANAMNAIGVYG